MSWIRYFKNWARKYDQETESYGYRPARLIEPFLHPIGKREKCLDVGCGTGKSLEVVSKFCRRVVGVEPVEKMARQADSRGFEVLRFRGEEIGRLKERFDLITFFASIDYMKADQVVRGCKKLLDVDGLVFFTVESQNEARFVKEFEGGGFQIVKRVVKKAYDGQDYVCLLLSAIKG